MTSWKRIILVIFVVIGSVTAFGYWSISQFNQALDNVSASYLASTHSLYAAFKQSTKRASTSQEITGELATSTDATILLSTATTTDSTSSLQASATTTPVTSTDVELSFTFPKSGDDVYIDCTYPISWQSSTTIDVMETVLVDAGTGESAGPIASGLAREYIIETDAQGLDWKVGIVWPGDYYIKVLKVNGTDTEMRSKVFTIHKMTEGIHTDEREKICKGSGGLLETEV